MAKESAPTKRKGRIQLKKMAILLLILLICYVAFSLIGSVIAFRVIFHRSDSASIVLELTYADVDQALYPRMAVRFPQGDHMLQGYFYKTENDHGTIVIVHGFSGGADSHLAETLYFIDHGWSVFCFDGTGCRESDGDSTIGLTQMKLDLMAALKYLNSERPDSPLVLYGHSMGGYAAAAVLDNFPEVRAAVCISAFNSPVETMYYHARQRVGVLADVEYPFLRLWNYFLFGAESDETAVSAINSANAPVLLIYGSEDEIIPESISLYAHRQELTDPYVTTMLIEASPRNHHSTIWLTEESASYHLEMQGELDAKEHSSEPSTVPADFLSRLDRTKLCNLDADFMDLVNDFFLLSAS